MCSRKVSGHLILKLSFAQTHLTDWFIRTNRTFRETEKMQKIMGENMKQKQKLIELNTSGTECGR